MNKFRKSLFKNLILILGVLFIAACGEAKELQLKQLHNSQIKLDGTPFGLIPKLNSDLANKIIQDKDFTYKRALLKGLNDKDKYAICHIILSDLYPEAGSGKPLLFPLQPDLGPKGTTIFKDEDQSRVKQFWDHYFTWRLLSKLPQ